MFSGKDLCSWLGNPLNLAMYCSNHAQLCNNKNLHCLLHSDMLTTSALQVLAKLRAATASVHGAHMQITPEQV